jgi:hypothetical protein
MKMNWEQRAVKKDVRALLLNQLWFNRPISYMGLPAGEALFEYDLLRKHRLETLYLFERDPSVFARLLRNTAPLELSGPVVHLLQEDVDSWLSATGVDSIAPGLDFVWLDYCGPITTQRLEHAKSLLSSMPLDGIFAVTFMVGREKTSARTLLAEAAEDDILSYSYLPSAHLNRVKAILRFLQPLNIHFDVLVQPYSDGTPMLLLVFKKSRLVNSCFLPLTRTVVSINGFLQTATLTDRRLKPVVCSGILYPSIRAAASLLNLTPYLLRKRLDDPSDAEFFFHEA